MTIFASDPSLNALHRLPVAGGGATPEEKYILKSLPSDQLDVLKDRPDKMLSPLPLAPFIVNEQQVGRSISKAEPGHPTVETPPKAHDHR